MILIFSCQKEDNILYPKGSKLKQILAYSSKESEYPLYIASEYEYNDKDKISKVTSPMYQDGKIIGTIYYDLYDYDSKGQLIKIENFNANNNSPTGFINLKNYIYTYSLNGKKRKGKN